MMKKKIVNILMLLVISLMTFSCSEDEVVTEQPLEVNPITMQGTWKLAELNGEQLPEDFYIYVVFDRKGNFEMYQKHDSMYPRYITGTYSIERMPTTDTSLAENTTTKTATGTTNMS